MFTKLQTFNEERCTQPIRMIELKLPLAKETHEILHEPVSNKVFVSQMSKSVLVELSLDDSGSLLSVEESWQLGNASSGLHNLSLSPSHPGFVWGSLQFNNTIFLFDANTKEVVYNFKVPTAYVSERKCCLLGGPHCVRECPLTGNIWVALKGTTGCCPGTETPDKLKKKLRQCCDVSKVRQFMEDENEPIPDGYAVWCVNPSTYNNEDFPCFGGELYLCEPSPPMMDIDTNGTCWVAQDNSRQIMSITGKVSKQHKIPHPSNNCDLYISGPAMVFAPDGAVWCSLLGGHSTLVRVDSNTHKPSLYEIGHPEWTHCLKFIHLTFDVLSNCMYAIASDLLEETSVNAVVILQFKDGWSSISGRRVIPLPTQDCSCHRITLVETENPENRSILVTEMASSKVFQMKINNVTDFALLDEVINEDETFEFRSYINLPEDDGRRV